MNLQADITVIGGGPAGLAAALAAKQHGAKRVLILERDRHLGGILQQCIHNGFGLHYFGQELTGPEYAGRFIDEVKKTDIEIMTDTMVLSVSPDRTVAACSAQNGMVQVRSGAVILAMGCRERTRGALNIPGTRPAGVYTAGCAQRLVNMEGYMPGSRVVILGSGDIGLIMARRMTWEGAKVEMVCELMPYSSGLNRNIVQCLKDNDIPLYFNTTVTRIHGRERVEGVTVAQVDEHRQVLAHTARFVPCDTLLLSVGLIPENELTLGAGIRMDPVTGGAQVDETRQCSVPGIFACGNVLHVHDLVDNVSQEAQIAGAAAAAYVGSAGAKNEKAVCVLPGSLVRYAVPQQIHSGGTGKQTIYFRVSAAVRGAQLTVKCAGAVIAQRKKAIMTPGEMEKIEVDAEKITGDLTLDVKGA
jgi:NADPH-dependent 2,4-dienoyl-CoA reductase/sulfur reductase-like enzyme